MPPIIIPLIPRVTPVAVIQLKREGETVRFWSNAEVIITQKKNFNFCSRFLWSARWLPPHLVQFAGPGLDSTWVSYCLLQADHAHKGRVQKPSHGIRAESPWASTDEIFPQQKLTDGKAILLNGGFFVVKNSETEVFEPFPNCPVLSFNMLQHQLRQQLPPSTITTSKHTQNRRKHYWQQALFTPLPPFPRTARPQNSISKISPDALAVLSRYLMWVLVCKRVLKSSAVHGTSTTAPLIHSISPSKGTFCPLLQSFEKLWQKIATLVISEALHRVRHCNCFFCFITVSRQKSVQMQSSCFTSHPWLAASLLLASSLLHHPNRSNKLIGHQSGIVWKHIWHIGPSLFKACKYWVSD